MSRQSTFPGLITLLDFETTGKYAESARATEIGMVAWDDSLNEVARFETLIRPPFNPGKEAQVRSGITEAMLSHANPFHDYWPDIAPFLDGRILVAYNSNYDVQILANELTAMHLEFYPPAVCAYRMAARVFPKSMAGDHKLPSLTQYFGIKHDAHVALGDVLATGELLKLMLHQFPHEVQHFLAAEQRLERIKLPTKTGVKPINRHDVLGKKELENGVQAASALEKLEVRGIETLTTIAKSLLAGNKLYIALTGNPSQGKALFAEQAKSVGFEYSRNPVGKRVTALLVVGVEETGQTKIFDAQQKGVSIVNDSEWQILVKILKEMRNA